MANGSKGSKIFTFVLFSVLLALAYQWQQNRRKEEFQTARREAERVAQQRERPDGGSGGRLESSRERPDLRGKEKSDIQPNAARGVLAEKGSHPDFPTADLAGTASLVQMAELGRKGRVRWVRSFGVTGLDYRSRKLNGANALSGCGFESTMRTIGSSPCFCWTQRANRHVTEVVSQARNAPRRPGTLFVWREENTVAWSRTSSSMQIGKKTWSLLAPSTVVGSDINTGRCCRR